MAQTTSGAVPIVRVLPVQVPALGATTTGSYIARAPFAGVVSSVKYVPIVAVTGADTNTRTLAVTNKGLGGAGSTAVASLALVSGANLVAFDENALTNNATAANLVVAEGDILSYTSTYAASGLADPGGTLFITITTD